MERDIKEVNMYPPTVVQQLKFGVYLAMNPYHPRYRKRKSFTIIIITVQITSHPVPIWDGARGQYYLCF